MSGKIKFPQDPDLGLLSEALKECAKLKHYVRRVQTRITGMEEPVNSGVYAYADKELEKISGYVGHIEGKISKYIFNKTKGELE
ncbi:hypothetical protein MUO65_02210 [bacterium]|nr:hypothetical protein [bacterium]